MDKKKEIQKLFEQYGVNTFDVKCPYCGFHKARERAEYLNQPMDADEAELQWECPKCGKAFDADAPIKEIKVITKEEFEAPNKEVIATNRSYWQWEYDADERDASLLKDANDNLTLQIVQTHTKSGIGAGVRKQTIVDEPVGTLLKPELGKIRSILKQHSHDRTRAGYPFPLLWYNPKTKEKDKISNILMSVMATEKPTAASVGPIAEKRKI